MVGHKKNIKDKSKIVQSKVSEGISNAYKKYANGFNRPSLLLNLEARMMFDGAAPAVADEILENANNQSPEALPAPTGESQEASQESSQETTESSTEASDDVDGIADSLEVGDATASEIVTAEEVNDALSIDGAESTVEPLFGPSALQASSDTVAVNAVIETTVATTVAEPTTEDVIEEVATESTVDNADDEVEEVEEVAAEEPQVSRVVFIDTSVAGYEDLLDGVIQEVELSAEDNLAPVDLSSVVATESSDADTANLSTAPPAADEVSSSTTTQASNGLGADTEIEDSGYTVNEDGAIIIDGVAIYLLDPADNQVEEITNTLAGYTGLEAIDIISHGAAGEIQLGNQRINSETLDGYADQIAQWGDALAENGDIPVSYTHLTLPTTPYV